jgi:ATP-binding cassette subfamily F protein uup
MIGQGDELDEHRTIRDELVGGRADHEWAGDAAFRDVLDGLLGGVAIARFPQGLDTPIAPLSGGERRRIGLARLLLDSPELLLLDEPTNHLDVEGIDWLARHLAARSGSLVVVTHDRWFLDAVCTATWEVADGAVHQYEGGYAAYVLARAERDRQAAAREDRRQQLVRKELAWLRRGPPARTSKPQFRIDAANALIADEPPARDRLKLVEFATTRLGKTVVDLEDVTVRYGDRAVIDGVTFQLGPGDRFGILGPNGAGKSTLVKLLAGTVQPTAGTVKRGKTVRVATLEQEPAPVDEDQRVLEAVEEVAQNIDVPGGRSYTAGQLLERFLFPSSRQWARVGDLSGGERRRLQVLRLLMAEPNLLLLDEPTNDLDIETLTALEDHLDGWPGTLVVVSHDRYFLERTCDRTFTVAGGRLRDLPGGVEQYVAERVALGPTPVTTTGAPRTGASASAGDTRAARKELTRLERVIARIDQREARLHADMAAQASDYAAVQRLDEELRAVQRERSQAEDDWLALADGVDG